MSFIIRMCFLGTCISLSPCCPQNLHGLNTFRTFAEQTPASSSLTLAHGGRISGNRMKKAYSTDEGMLASAQVYHASALKHIAHSSHRFK